ncbi:MAG: hypothetical protein ACI9NY_001812 [Kiritimatiellia bacterium]|jgi:hypothetical protein
MLIPTFLPSAIATAGLNTSDHFKQVESHNAQQIVSEPSAQHQSKSRVSAYSVEIRYQHNNHAFTYSHLNHSSSSSSVSETVAVKEVAPRLDGAKNILHFIEKRIATETAAGASDEVIEELLQQGLSGFKQGYGEALQLLEDAGDLGDEANSAVSTLHQQVISGIDDLRLSYLGESALPAETSAGAFTLSAPSSPVINPSKSDQLISFLSKDGLSSNATNPLQDLAALKNENISSMLDALGNIETTMQYARKESFLFQLTTTDGDSITIQANNQSDFSSPFSMNTDAEHLPVNGSENSNNNSHFAFSIEGELDENETLAIENLLSQVMSLADDFYQGDVASAYAAALALGYDQSEIIGYALELKQTESFKAAASYQQFERSNVNSNNMYPTVGAGEIFDRIGSYAQSVLEALHKPSNYPLFNYTEIMENISEQIEAQIKSSTQQGFDNTIKGITQRLS